MLRIRGLRDLPCAVSPGLGCSYQQATIIHAHPFRSIVFLFQVNMSGYSRIEACVPLSWLGRPSLWRPRTLEAGGCTVWQHRSVLEPSWLWLGPTYSYIIDTPLIVVLFTYL